MILLAKVHVVIDSQFSLRTPLPDIPTPYTFRSGFHWHQATLTDIDFPILTQRFNIQHPLSNRLGAISYTLSPEKHLHRYVCIFLMCYVSTCMCMETLKLCGVAFTVFDNIPQTQRLD